MFGGSIAQAQQQKKEPQTIDDWKKEYQYFTEQYDAQQRVNAFDEVKRVAEESENCIPIVVEWHNKCKKLIPLEKRKYFVQRDVKLGELYEQINSQIMSRNYNHRGEIYYFNKEQVLDHPNVKVGKIYDDYKSGDDNILYIIYADHAKVYEPEKKKK